jgi:hypothetical protein
MLYIYEKSNLKINRQMKSEIFNSLYVTLLEHKKIEVCVSLELEIWNDACGKNEETVNYFFAEIIHNYGIFHDLLGKSDAHGDNYELTLSVFDGSILMEGKTYITGEWEEEDRAEPEEKCFKWIFDKRGNVILIE